MKKQQNNAEFLGIGFRILSGVGFAVMSGLIKYLGDAIPLGEVVFFRSVFALIPIIICLMLGSNHFAASLKTHYPWKHVLRCLTATLGMFFAFAALRYLPLAEATAMSYLTPIFTMVLAVSFLKETSYKNSWLGLLLGVFGLALMTVPNFSTNTNIHTLLGVILGVASALCISVAMIQMRQLSQVGENPAAIAFYFVLTSTVIGGLTLFSDWQTPSFSQLVCLIAIGIVGGVAQIMMILAYRYAKASLIAPYEYLSVIWAIFIGIVIFSEMPTTLFFFAMPLILVGAIIATPRKNIVKSTEK